MGAEGYLSVTWLPGMRITSMPTDEAEAKERKKLIGKMKQALERKLEDLVLETMNHPDDLPADILEMERIARENGFTQAQIGIEQIFEEFGRIEVERKIDRIRNSQRNNEEKKLQDYFVAEQGKRVGEIELGLKYIGHEKVVRAGRLDIHAHDAQGKEVKVELKARDYDSKAVFYQIMKYYQDDKTGDARIIFIAPEVKPDLLFSLAQYQQTGRMKFFEYEQMNGNVNLKERKPEDVPDAKPIDWSKKKRNKNGEIRIKAGNARKQIKSEKIQEAKEEEAEEEWKRLPTYEKLRRAFLPKVRFTPIEVSGQRYTDLTRLLYTLEEIRQYDAPANSSMNVRLNVTDREMKLMESYVNYNSHQMSQFITNYLRSYGSIFDRARKEKGGLEDAVGQLSDMKAAIEMITRDLCREYYGEVRKIIKKQETKFVDELEYLMEHRMKRLEIISNAAEIKIKRIKALSKHDKELARIYAMFSPKSYGILFSESSTHEKVFTGGDFVFEESDIANFMAADNQLYKTLLENFFKASELEEKAKVQPVVVQAPVQPLEVKKQVRYTPDSVMRGYSSEHTPDEIGIRVRDFVDEELNLSNYTEELKSKVAKTIRASEWQKAGLTPGQVIYLFDEVKIALAKGQYPENGNGKYMEGLIGKAKKYGNGK